MKKKGKSKEKNKELETSITGKFMEVVHGLGHDAEKLKKEIAKAGKAVSEKISSAFKSAQKEAAKEAGKVAKKAEKKKDEVKTGVKKAEAKAEKVVSEVSKAASGKVSTASGRSVAKPAAPALDKSQTNPVKKEEVKEASAATPVKRKRAPRKKIEAPNTQPDAEKTPVKEASAATPVKRKRAPGKSKPATATDGNPATETTGSAVL